MPPHEPLTIGERLRKRRDALGLKTEDVASEIAAPVKYVTALETDQYEIFSAKVYAQGFLKKLLTVLSYEEADAILQEFKAEWSIRFASQERRPTPLPENRGQEPYITSKRLMYGLGGGLLLAFGVFLGFRLLHFVGLPQLIIEEPAENAAFGEPIVRIRGTTERESRLTVNGRMITIDAEGNFDDRIDLATGLQTLEFFVENRFGKIKKAIRHILIR